MTQASLAPFELISYRGLLKSAHDIKNDYFSNRADNHDETKKDNNSKTRKHFITPMKDFIMFHFFLVINAVEKLLVYLMACYDLYIYSPLQTCLKPVVKQIPRYVNIFDLKIPVFTANIITLSRTFLVVPIAWCLKYDYNQTAMLFVVLHDFLDHLDGIVAKVHLKSYPNLDDPLLGGFLDAFCDKIVNVLSLWSIIQTLDFGRAGSLESFFFLAILYSVIAYETIIGVVRVQDFFLAKFKKEFKVPETLAQTEDPTRVTAASMEGKLKEKLESSGVALLCVSVSKTYQNPINNAFGISGLICLLLTLRMAHKSLSLKLEARREQRQKSALSNGPRNSIWDVDASEMVNNSKQLAASYPSFETAQMKMVDCTGEPIVDDNHQCEFAYKRPRFSSENLNDDTKPHETTKSVLEISTPKDVIDNRVDKVYTIGCFDLFHHGHVQLIKRMRELGKKVIVGVHDSRSIQKLKNRVPVDSTEKRMLNVKTIADEVFCIAGCDPSNFMTCIVNLDASETALYVRGDDMPNFPSREVVENLMPIKFLPYTEGVSSTQLRREKFSHIAADDYEYLEMNS